MKIKFHSDKQERLFNLLLNSELFYSSYGTSVAIVFKIKDHDSFKFIVNNEEWYVVNGNNIWYSVDNFLDLLPPEVRKLILFNIDLFT